MRKRVRKVQVVRIMEMITGRIREVKVKHDNVRPVRTMVAERIEHYQRQNGGAWLTPAQARRVRLKGGASTSPVRGRCSTGGRAAR